MKGMNSKLYHRWLRGVGVAAAVASIGLIGSGFAPSMVPSVMAQEHGGGSAGGCSGGGCGGGGHESEAGHTGGGGGGGGGHGAGRGQGTRGGASGHGSGIHGSRGQHSLEEEGAGHSGFSGGGSRHVPSGVSGGHAPSSAARLGRLNAARAYLSPGFKSERIMSEGESESPLYQLGRYQQALQGTDPDVQRAGEYLGNAATIAVTPAVVSRVNEMMGVTVTPAQAAAIAAAAEAQRLSNKESHDEGEESSHEHSVP